MVIVEGPQPDHFERNPGMSRIASRSDDES